VWVELRGFSLFQLWGDRAGTPGAPLINKGSGEIMFGSHKVKIEGDLLEKVKQCSDAAGYESIDEFVIHMLEKETKKIIPDESSTSKEEIQKRLRGLGYIE
jgi:hypothetical protein